MDRRLWGRGEGTHSVSLGLIPQGKREKGPGGKREKGKREKRRKREKEKKRKREIEKKRKREKEEKWALACECTIVDVDAGVT